MDGRCETYTRARTSNSGAPSLRSATVVTGRARSKVAKNEMKALISFISCSDIRYVQQWAHSASYTVPGVVMQTT